VDDLIGVSKNRQISPAPSDGSLELVRAVMPDFLSRNWYGTFIALSNAVKNLPANR
jgi:hypothetical protein